MVDSSSNSESNSESNAPDTSTTQQSPVNPQSRQSRFTTRRISMSTEQRAAELERMRLRARSRRENMTEEERFQRNLRRREVYRAGQQALKNKTLASSSTNIAQTPLFEHVIHQHTQAEVQRIIGRFSTTTLNTSEGYMELGPQHRAPLSTHFEDMLDFDDRLIDRENEMNESHSLDFQEGQSSNRQPSRNTNSRSGSNQANKGSHNCAKGFIDLPALPRLQITDFRSCIHCRAKLFPHEPNGFCCLNGKVSLPELPVPSELLELYTTQSDVGVHFRHHIRSYNHVFSFTSIGVHIDSRLANCTNGVYTYRAQGTMYHKIGSLIPEAANRPRFLQMYIYDTEHELENRLKEQRFAASTTRDAAIESESLDAEDSLNRHVLDKLKTILDRCNPYVRVIRQISQVNDLHGVRLHIKEQATYRRVYNMPTSPQVAAVLVGGEDPSEINPRDVIIETKTGQLLNVPDTACFYDPLQYPLLLPYGSFGWDLTLFNDSARRISCRAYYSYTLQIRESQDSIILRAGKLLQQYVVDNYVKISTMQLRWVRDHQKTFRADLYSGVLDAVNEKIESIWVSGRPSPRYKPFVQPSGDIGQRVILPPTYIGSPRDMHQRYYDAMALVQKFGKPDFFITMTCNPNWVEIQNELYPGQVAHDRPDLTTRVFNSKFEDMKTDLFTKGVLGKVVAHVYVIEFQKRGLPHAHVLMIVDERDKLRRPFEYDQAVRAEIPNRDIEPELHAAVIKHMIHTPCVLSTTSVCKKNGKCKKKFPKQFVPETREGEDSYPVYRIRDNGIEVTLHNGKVVNNSWVVPYNPWLLKKYDCHINVEVCSSVKSVKYLYKYVWKGVDRVSMEVSSEKESNDEIKQFVDARWICPQEALWRIYRYQLNKIYPPVISLQVHLKDKQRILLPEDCSVQDVLQQETISRTKLTEFFKKNQEDDFAKTLLYKEFPEHYVWNKSLKKWQRRVRNNKVVGRVSVVSTRSDSYHLRLLLNNIRGPTSFEDLLKVGPNTFSTYHEVAEHLGLLESNTVIRDTLIEAVAVQMPSALRRLFCTLLLFCNPTGVRDLWDEFLPHLIEDHLRYNTPNGAVNLLLREVSSALGPVLMAEYQLPNITEDVGTSITNELIGEEKSIPISAEDLSSVDRLNNDQKRAFERIVDSVSRNESSIYFIDGPGGLGKTFLYKAILAFLRNQGYNAIATATSGIAATMMPGGRTAHSRFKIPVPADSTSTCNICVRDDLADLIRKASLIIWDQATMANRYAFEAVDQTLRDLMQTELPFGGKIFVLGGDFRQVLPVVQHGSRGQIVNVCLTSASFWKDVSVISLKENMRARLDPDFSDFLLRVGDGIEPYVIEDMVKLPQDLVLEWNGEQSVRHLIDEVFPQLKENAFDSVYMSQRALITPRNDIVEKLNQKVVEIFPGSEVVYHSFDSVENDTNHLWTEDFLNSIAPGGLPPHKLILKIGAPIMLLRNLDPKNGLCNGTRLLCRRLLKNSIDAEIFSGSCSGTRVLIPRIPLEPSNDTKLPFKFVRKQFPVRASFALTINKSQGQTIPNVGVYLGDHVFSHGQLYVALSRGISRNTTKVLVSHGNLPEFAGTYTRNVVFQEILRLCAPSGEDSLRGAEPEITGQYANNARNKGKQKIQEPVFTVEGSTSCLTSHENSSRGSSSTMIDDLALTSHNL